jgi:hypothetical protein
MNTCQRCRGTDRLITGDGPILVCRDCVELLGNVVSKPWECSERLLGELLELHSGSVKLARTASPPHELVWEWVA